MQQNLLYRLRYWSTKYNLYDFWDNFLDLDINNFATRLFSNIVLSYLLTTFNIAKKKHKIYSRSPNVQNFKYNKIWQNFGTCYWCLEISCIILLIAALLYLLFSVVSFSFLWIHFCLILYAAVRNYIPVSPYARVCPVSSRYALSRTLWTAFMSLVLLCLSSRSLWTPSNPFRAAWAYLLESATSPFAPGMWPV